MGLNNRGWDGKNPTINISVYCIQNTEKFSNKKSFLHKGGYFCIIRQILTRKRAKSLILHIMKSIQTIIKCNIMYIVYKIEDFDCYAYTPMGGNLCKFAHHTTIKLIK